MTDSRDWHFGLAPATDMEHRQAATEAMYLREQTADEAARFAEAPGPVRICRRCYQRPADGPGMICVRCWLESDG